MRDSSGPTFSTRQLRLRGITLNCVVEGDGPPVLLVHGFPDDHHVWRHQIAALLAAGYRVIAPDMRGCGESDAPNTTAAYLIPELVADLVALLDELGVARVSLLAHDWGSVIGWFFAMQHPERIQRYIALSVGHPTAYARGSIEQKLKGYYTFVFLLRGVAELCLQAGNWHLLHTLTAHTESARWADRLARPGRLKAALSYYRANWRLILPRAHPPVNVPVLGIWGDGDRFLSESQMIDSARWANDFRYERLTGASHWLQLDAPDKLNRLVLDFLA